MMLPAHWVDALFARLTLRYGAAFLRQWPDADPDLVKTDWADVLGFLHRHPRAIQHALDNLPSDRPPNAMQFRALAMPELADARQPVAPALPAPQVDPAVVTAALAGIRPAAAPGAKTLAQQCVENIEAAALRRPLTSSQRWVLERCREQAKHGPADRGIAHSFTPIPVDALPPGMRPPAAPPKPAPAPANAEEAA